MQSWQSSSVPQFFCGVCWSRVNSRVVITFLFRRFNFAESSTFPSSGFSLMASARLREFSLPSSVVRLEARRGPCSLAPRLRNWSFCCTVSSGYNRGGNFDYLKEFLIAKYPKKYLFGWSEMQALGCVIPSLAASCCG